MSGAEAYSKRIDEEALRNLRIVERASGASLDKRADSQFLERSAPEPLRRTVPPSEPYPVEALGPIIAPACRSLMRVIQAPDAICGASLLAAASLATQGLADVHIDGRMHPLTLWLLTVAESGERKSAVDAAAMRGIREFELELSRAYRGDLADYAVATEVWKTRRESAKKGKQSADALHEIGAPPEPPLDPSLTVADFTAEGLFKLLRGGRASVGAFADEAGLVFGGHGMTRETVVRTAASLSKLWDRGELDRIRSSDGVTKLWGRRMALHLMAQPVIAERALSDSTLSGQGFLPRCLLAWPEGKAGTRKYRAESLRDDEALIQFTACTAALLSKPLPLEEGSRNELVPRALQPSSNAKEEWISVHDAIERAEAPDGRYGSCKAWASKSAEQCLRIAGVLTLIENPDAQQIEVDAISRATQLALWHLNEAVRLTGTAELSPEVRNAEALLTWCHDTGRRHLHSRAALRLGPNCIRENRTFTNAMRLLEQTGWAERIEGGVHLDGKHRRRVWQIQPECEDPK